MIAPPKLVQSPKLILVSSFLSLLAAAANGETLDTITVTAQKRPESLSDVPISVSSVSGERIANTGINGPEDLSAVVPNFSVIKEPLGDKINIRGIQSGSLASFEQSVAVFVDDVYHGRGIQSRWSFLDVERVEVLRGPQATLFGKNAVAGAMNVVTAGPTKDRTGELSIQFAPEFDETELRGVISGPLSDSFRGRLVISSRDMNEGWVNNTAYNEDNPALEEVVGRASLEWDINEHTTVFAKYEKGSFETTGQPWVLVDHGPLQSVMAAAGIPEGRGYLAAIGNNGFAPLGFSADPVLDIGSNSRFDADTDEAVLKVTHTLGNDAIVTAIAAHSSYDFERFADIDMNPLPVIRFDDSESFDQSSLELRLSSSVGGKIEYITGLYLQDSGLDADGLAQFNLGTIDTLLSLNCSMLAGAPAAVVPGDPVASAIAVAGLPGSSAATANACAQTALTQVLVPAGISGASRYAFLEQESDSAALFAQGTWHVSDAVRIAAGLRYTQENKEASQGAHAAGYAARDTSALADQSPANPQALAAFLIGEFTPHSFAPSDPGMTRDDDALTWSFNTQWDVSGDAMLYVSAGTGTKSGGYNSFYMGLPQGAGADPMETKFEEEDVLSFEVGAKLTILNGAAELSIAAFHASYDDLQVAVFSGNTTFVVQNAAEATSRGIEVDARWRPTDHLTIQAAVGWLDFEYDSFSAQGCVAEQFIAFRESAFQSALATGDQAGAGIAALAVSNRTCALAGVNDLRGRPSAHSPDWSIALFADHRAQSGAYEFASRIGLNWNDEVYRQDDLDPRSLQGSFTKLNAALVFGPIDGQWDLSLLGTNLTDETTVSYVNDTPLFAGARQARMDPPRNIGIRGRWYF